MADGGQFLRLHGQAMVEGFYEFFDIGMVDMPAAIVPLEDVGDMAGLGTEIEKRFAQGHGSVKFAGVVAAGHAITQCH